MDVNEEITRAHQRLDAAEDAAIRARVLSPEIMAEYADSGHAYYAVLYSACPADAARIHGEHYDQCRPRIEEEFYAEGERAGLFRVHRDRTGHVDYLTYLT